MVHYIGSFSRQAEEYGLFQAPAAATKMRYIADTIQKQEKLILVSICGIKKHKFSIMPFTKIKISDNETDIIAPSIGAPIKLLRGINLILIWLFLFIYIVFFVKKNDIVLLYHSVAYVNPILFARKIKRFKLILEVEEIYSDVSGKNDIQKEYRIFKVADAFLSPTKLLLDKINIYQRPAVIIHGTYQVEQFSSEIDNDDTIHCVYAGTFDPRKGGAVAAAAAAEYLPSNYHIHILGFGSENDIENMKSYVSEVAKKSSAKVSYDGLLSGEDYIKFIQSCDIGLSTQNPDAAFNATSFPSKILSYMSNGLRVVTIRIPAIETSDIGDNMYYYDKQTPKEIAKAILSINLNDNYDARSIIMNLDLKFINDIQILLEEVEKSE